jgi:hypothetical protein
VEGKALPKGKNHYSLQIAEKLLIKNNKNQHVISLGIFLISFPTF